MKTALHPDDSNVPDRHEAEGAPLPPVEQQILRAVRSVRYGSVEVVIQDSKVVQIERKEKFRLTKS